MNEQDDAMLLDQPWPSDLDPARVPFRRRTMTVMERAGLFDDPAAIDDLTEDDVLSWENAGVLTLQDFITAGNAGIFWHHGPARDLAPVASSALGGTRTQMAPAPAVEQQLPGFAADPVVVAVEPVRIRWRHGEPPERDVADAVQILGPPTGGVGSDLSPLSLRPSG